MDATTLQDRVESVLERIRAGQALDKELLTPVFQYVPSDAEVAAVTNQIATLRVLTDEQAASLIIRWLQSQPTGTSPLAAQQRLVDELFATTGVGQPLSLRVRQAFGVISRRHETVLQEAVRGGRLNREEALRLIGNGAALSRHLGDASAARVPLFFRTIDFNGLPQAADHRLHGWTMLPAPGAAPPQDVTFEETLAIPTPGEPFSFVVSNELELGQAALPEEGTTRWLQATIRPASVLWDVGANVGYYSLYAASLHPTVRAVCFEPGPMNVGRLNENIRINRVAGRVVAFPIAISNTTGLSTFGNSCHAAGGWSHRGLVHEAEIDNWITGALNDGCLSESDAAEARDRNSAVFLSGCAIYSLDDVSRCAAWLARPTHLKIDVDGLEVEVLRGAAQLLREDALEHVSIEVLEDKTAPAVERILRRAGFTPSSPRPPTFANWIFERRR